VATWYRPEDRTSDIVITRQPGGCLAALLSPSTVALIGANVVNGYFALTQSWNGATLLWSFWAQSLIIGAFAALRLLRVPNYAMEDPDLPDRRLFFGVPLKRLKTSLWFLVIYGIYSLFFVPLSAVVLFDSPDWHAIAVASGVFVASHFVSYLQTRSNDLQGRTSGAVVFWGPFVRVMPLILLFTMIWPLLLTPAALPVFVLVKALVDVGGHVLRHAYVRLPRTEG
jgi:hypothetical protein